MQDAYILMFALLANLFLLIVFNAKQKEIEEERAERRYRRDGRGADHSFRR